MSKAQYDIYVGNNVQLIRTLVIKSELTAQAINRGLTDMGNAVNEVDPATWKYYLNLSGQYHPTDAPMTVTSLDTLQTIDFTKDNLQIHTSTLREYSRGEHYYERLLEQFPNQQSLIDGILHPIDLQTAVDASDGQILYFDRELVESNETNVIQKLQDWIDKFNIRWHVRAYNLTDELYAAGQLGVLFSLLPSVLMNIRLENCHTRFVHSYHIRSFLASHGGLDVFVDYMTRRQMLWLYRNIRYLHRHAGKRATFETLVKNILTDRGFPLAEWTMRHDLEHMLQNIYAKIEFARTPVNFGYSSAGIDTRDIPNMLDAEAGKAKGNPVVQPEAELYIREQMENARQDRLPTKVLESSVLDTTDATPYTLTDALLNYWLYFAQTGQYTAIVSVDDPRSGVAVQFTVKDAFIIYLYCYNLARGVRMHSVPTGQAWMVRRQPTPSRDELRSLIADRFYPDRHVEWIMSRLEPASMRYVSTAGFNDAVNDLHRNLLDQRKYFTAAEHMHERGQVEQMVLRLYQDYTCNLANGDTYRDWFSVRGLIVDEYTPMEAGLLADQLLQKATGVDLKRVKSIQEIQRAMLQLMERLSSYSVQYLQQINTYPIRVIDWQAIRPGDENVHAYMHHQADVADNRVIDYHAKSHSHWKVGFDEFGPRHDTYVHAEHLAKLDAGLEWKDGSNLSIKERIEIADFTVLRIVETERSLAFASVMNSDDYVPVTLVPLKQVFSDAVIDEPLPSSDYPNDW